MMLRETIEKRITVVGLVLYVSGNGSAGARSGGHPFRGSLERMFFWMAQNRYSQETGPPVLVLPWQQLAAMGSMMLALMMMRRMLRLCWYNLQAKSRENSVRMINSVTVPRMSLTIHVITFS